GLRLHARHLQGGFRPRDSADSGRHRDRAARRAAAADPEPSSQAGGPRPGAALADALRGIRLRRVAILPRRRGECRAGARAIPDRSNGGGGAMARVDGHAAGRERPRLPIRDLRRVRPGRTRARTAHRAISYARCPHPRRPGSALGPRAEWKWKSPAIVAAAEGGLATTL